MHKRVFLVTVCACYLLTANAQVKSNMALGVETGFPIYSGIGKLSLFVNVEPKLKVSDRLFLGVRFGCALNTQRFEEVDSLLFTVDEEFDNAVISFVPTVEYYFNDNDRRPYVGAGIGYVIGPERIDVRPQVDLGIAQEVISVSTTDRLGFLLRAGVETNKLRVGLEYDYIQSAGLTAPDGRSIGIVETGYLGLSIGLIIGGP